MQESAAISEMNNFGESGPADSSSAGGVNTNGWVPNEQVLADLLYLFHMAQSPNAEIKQKLNVASESLQQRPDGMKYLVIVFSQYKNEPVTCRQMVGLFLKNVLVMTLRRMGSGEVAKEAVDPVVLESIEYVQKLTLAALTDGVDEIRRTAGTIVATMIAGLGCHRWPEALNVLMSYVKSTSLPIASTSLDTLRKIVEDSDFEEREDRGELTKRKTWSLTIRSSASQLPNC